MDIGGFLLGAVVSAVAAKVLWDKEKAKHYIALNALKEQVEAIEEASAKPAAEPEKEAPAKKAPQKKKPAAAKKKPSASAKTKKAPVAEDIEEKIKDAVGKLKEAGERVSLAAVSRESGVSYSRIKRQKELVEKYQ